VRLAGVHGRIDQAISRLPTTIGMVHVFCLSRIWKIAPFGLA
jgi:hypothetical protein